MSSVQKLIDRVIRAFHYANDIQNAGKIELYAILFQGNILPHSISSYRSISKDQRSASWWEENGDKAEIVKLKLSVESTKGEK